MGFLKVTLVGSDRNTFAGLALLSQFTGAQQTVGMEVHCCQSKGKNPTQTKQKQQGLVSRYNVCQVHFHFIL